MSLVVLALLVSVCVVLWYLAFLLRRILGLLEYMAYVLAGFELVELEELETPDQSRPPNIVSLPERS